MIVFSGRHYDVVYMPLKPNGFKIFIVSESLTGYVFSYEPYSSNNHGKTQDSEKKENFITVSLNLRLTEYLDNQDYHIYSDKYFTSAKTIIALK